MTELSTSEKLVYCIYRNYGHVKQIWFKLDSSVKVNLKSKTVEGLEPKFYLLMILGTIKHLLCKHENQSSKEWISIP